MLRALLQNETNSKENLTSVIKTIMKEQGLKGFYSGLKYDLIRILPTNFIGLQKQLLLFKFSKIFAVKFADSFFVKSWDHNKQRNKLMIHGHFT